MSNRRDVIVAVLRAEDWIDLGNNPGEDEEYDELARSIDEAIAASEMFRAVDTSDEEWTGYRVEYVQKSANGSILCSHRWRNPDAESQAL